MSVRTRLSFFAAVVIALPGLARTAGAQSFVVSSSTAGQVVRVDADGTRSTVSTGPDGIRGLASDAAGNAYVLNGSTVVRVAPGGGVSTVVGPIVLNSFVGPTQLARDSAGNFYTDSQSRFPSNQSPTQINKVQPSGTVTPFASGPGAGQEFNGFGGLATDAADNVYHADRFNRRVVRITPTGGVSVVATGLNEPSQLAVDPSGNIYVANAGDNTVARITPAGVVATLAANIASPGGIAYADGFVYVTSTQSTINRISLTGDVSVFASGLSGAFYLTAIPEPASLAVLGVAALATLRRTRRGR